MFSIYSGWLNIRYKIVVYIWLSAIRFIFFNVHRLPTCMSVHHVYAWYQRPERGSDPLELELWTVV